VVFTSGSGAANSTVSWTPGSASWSFTSDRNAKENFTEVDAESILERVSELPITEWNYKGYPQRHVGPMAQDFHAAFPLNSEDKMLNSADVAGVSLVAIQGLNQKVNQELKAKDAQIQQLTESVAELKEMVTKLVAQQKGGAR
jgi:hypothetical protein